MSARIIVGDCREVLAGMPSESVHCVVTSPPYWGLRDYGVEGQLGLEATPDEHVAAMVGVFREVRRVLRKDGTLWLNYGDCYASAVNGTKHGDTKSGFNDRYFGTQNGAGKQGAAEGRRPGTDWRHCSPQTDDDRTFRDKPFSTVGNGLKAKDLVGMPWRVAFALQADGWWLRCDIVWAKPNPMPESVTDRPTRSHEYLFLLAKSELYYYDSEAIREYAVARHPGEMDGGPHRLLDGSNANGGRNFRRSKAPDGWDTGAGGHGTVHRDGRESGKAAEIRYGRNKRSVWTISTQPYPEAHFATFPEALVEPCVLAGCPVQGTVLDPFAGSGTTLAVANRLDRNAIGIELNPAYARLAEKRVARTAPQMRLDAMGS